MRAYRIRPPTIRKMDNVMQRVKIERLKMACAGVAAGEKIVVGVVCCNPHL